MMALGSLEGTGRGVEPVFEILLSGSAGFESSLRGRQSAFDDVASVARASTRFRMSVIVVEVRLE